MSMVFTKIQQTLQLKVVFKETFLFLLFGLKTVGRKLMAAKPLKSSHKVLATCYWMHGSSHFGDESGQEKG